MTSRSLLVLACGIAGLGCGDRKIGPPSQTTLTQVPRPALEARVPVLRWVPPDADLVLVGRELSDFLSAAEQIASVVPELDISLLGSDPWNPEAWLKRGIDGEKSIALFVSGASASIVLPIVNPKELAAWSVDLSGGNAVGGLHRDLDVQRVQRGQTLWSWFQVEGFAVLHVSMAAGPSAEASFAWVDALVDASTGSAYSGTSDAETALALADDGRLWGSANPLSLLGTLVGGTEYLACTGLLGKMRGTTFSATLTGEGASIHSSLAIGEDAFDRLRGLRSPGASDGMLGQRESAGVYASVALDLQATAAALQDQECPELSRVLENPLASVGWSPPPRAVHLAGTHFNPGSLSGQVALEVALHSKRFIKQQLDQIPGRSWFETSITVEGQRANRLSIPTMSSLYYLLSEERLVFATKMSIFKSLLALSVGAGDGAEPSEAELAALGIWPERLPQLPKLLELAIPSREQREAAATFLKRLAYARFSVALKGNRLTMHAELSPHESAPTLWLGALW